MSLPENPLVEKDKRESSLNQTQIVEEEIKPARSERKRNLITGVNSLVGHGLFEQMRNDHDFIHDPKKADKFMGTLI